MGAYSGNSPAKDQVRKWSYEGGEPLRKNDYHIVIASRECGDIKYLTKVGVPSNNIIACDIDPYARAEAAKLGVIVSPFGDIVKTTQWAIQSWGHTRIATVNVDLCMTLPIGTPILREVIKACTKRQDIFFTFLRGRDKMRSSEQRFEYLKNQVHRTYYDVFEYQSKTYMSPGSPMCTVSYDAT